MKKFMILAIVLSSSMGIYLKDDSLLCGQNKKQKQEKIAKKKKHKTCATRIDCAKTNDIQEYYNYTAQDNGKIVHQIIVLSDKLEKRLVELEQLLLYHDDQLAQIKDCLYKEYMIETIEPSNGPFENFKKWLFEPLNQKVIDMNLDPGANE